MLTTVHDDDNDDDEALLRRPESARGEHASMRETTATKVLRLVREGEAERRKLLKEERRRARESRGDRQSEGRRPEASKGNSVGPGKRVCRDGDGQEGDERGRQRQRIVPLKPEAFYGRCRIRDITKFPRILNYLVRVHRRLKEGAKDGVDEVATDDAPNRMAPHFRVFPRQAFAFRFIDLNNCDGDEGGDREGCPPPMPEGSRCTMGRLWPFSFEEHASGRRRFLATSYAEFSRRYFSMPDELRHCYEIIREGAPCHMYFDLEFARGDGCNELCDGDAMVDALLVLLQRALLARFGIDMDDAHEAGDGAGIREHVLELDSSTPSKFSRHLVVILPRGRVFANNIHVGAFVKELMANAMRDRGDDPVSASMFVEKLPTAGNTEPATASARGRHSVSDAALPPAPTSHESDATDGDGRAPPLPAKASAASAIGGAGGATNLEGVSEIEERCGPDQKRGDGCDVPFVDLGVYSRNRAFRLPFSSKAKKTAKLLPTGRLGFIGLVRGHDTRISQRNVAFTAAYGRFLAVFDVSSPDAPPGELTPYVVRTLSPRLLPHDAN